MRAEIQSLYDRIDASQPAGTSGMVPMLEELAGIDRRLDEIVARTVEVEAAAAARKVAAAAAA